MEDLVRSAIELAQSKAKHDTPWKLDEPYIQPVYRCSQVGTNHWTTVTQASLSETKSNKLSILSWNVDFMLPFPDSRMGAAIRHLESIVNNQKEHGTAHVVFLAECIESDLKLIAADQWVQSNFMLTDLDNTFWQSGHYGTAMLIDINLEVSSCFRVHYSKTRMERDGLFIDVQIGSPRRLFRLCNTHLESLALEPPYRPLQLQLCANYMHESDIHGAVLAGDLNAIQPFDRTLHEANKLKDAYLEFGGSEDDAEAGHTWGQQASTTLRERFGTSRMDKIYFCGDLHLLLFERFGVGVEVEDENERQNIVKLGFEHPWITDHFGVNAIFKIG